MKLTVRLHTPLRAPAPPALSLRRAPVRTVVQAQKPGDPTEEEEDIRGAQRWDSQELNLHRIGVENPLRPTTSAGDEYYNYPSMDGEEPPEEKGPAFAAVKSQRREGGPTGQQSQEAPVAQAEAQSGSSSQGQSSPSREGETRSGVSTGESVSQGQSYPTSEMAGGSTGPSENDPGSRTSSGEMKM